jgi:hypothetical protein
MGKELGLQFYRSGSLLFSLLKHFDVRCQKQCVTSIDNKHRRLLLLSDASSLSGVSVPFHKDID